MNLIQSRKIRPSELRRVALLFFVLAATVTVAAISLHSSAANTGNGDWDKRSPDIHWPARHAPNDADLFAHNELLIKSPCWTVWRHIIEAPKWREWYPNAHDVRIVKGRTDVLEANSRFEWNTFGLQIDSTVHEFVPETRAGWFGKGKDIDAYHTWLLASTPEGCKVVTEEVVIGPGAIALRTADPDAMHKGHDLWLSSLKQLSEK